MPKQYDSTLNELIESDTTRWGNFLALRAGVPSGLITTRDSDLSSTLQADRLFQVDGPIPAILHLELESSGRLGIPHELLRYNIAAWGMSGLPVHTLVMLLRPKANASDLTGNLELIGADKKPYVTFRYNVVRLWEESIEDLLRAGPGIAPLALLTNEAASDLPSAFHRLRERLHADDVDDTVESVVLGSAYMLCGLRYTSEQIETLYRDLNMTLEDSTTYQLILQKGLTKGRLQEARFLILRQGSKRFGEPAPAIASLIQGIADHEHLVRLADRVLDAANWEELMATP